MLVRLTRRLGPIPFCTALGLLAAGDLRAQEIWPVMSERNYFRLEVMRSSFEESDLGFANGAGEAALALALGQRARLILSLPVGFYSNETESDFGIGNPYLGVDFGAPGSRFYGQFGGRLPLASDGSGPVIGVFTDWDRAEAYFNDVASIIGTVGFRYHGASGLVVGARVGGSTWIPTGELSEEDPEVLGHYGLRVGYDRQRVVLGVAFTGRVVLTEEDADDRTDHQIAFDLGYRFDRVIPTIGVRLPLDEDLSTVLNNVVVVTLKVLW